MISKLSQSGKIKLIAIVTVTFVVVYYNFNKGKCESRVSYSDLYINNDLNLDTLFLKADSIELLNIKSAWKNFNLDGKSHETVEEGVYHMGRKLLVIAQKKDDKIHYSAVIFPNNYKKTQKYPVLLWANGLNQSVPSVDIFNNRNLTQLSKNIPDYFILVPSFRGQSLVIHGNKFCSDGFFGDAFNGATDDALRILHLSKKIFKELDDKRIAVYGESRGATVALLMAARIPSINAVVAVSAPVNFFSRAVYEKYQFQFKYQFLSQKKPISQIRANMIKSSPLFFIENYMNSLFLIHGEFDEIVPISNARKIIKKFENKPNLDTLIFKGGHHFRDMKLVKDWLVLHN